MRSEISDLSHEKGTPGEKYYENPLCISASDFGLHNAIMTERGIVFFDFEFAGWDDPAKAIVDFLLQPQQGNLNMPHFSQATPSGDRLSRARIGPEPDLHMHSQIRAHSRQTESHTATFDSLIIFCFSRTGSHYCLCGRPMFNNVC